MFASLQYSYAATFCWGFVLIASWVGAGSLVRALAWRDKDQRDVDWGLRAGWGMAAHLAVGGVLCALHLAYRPVIFLVTLAPAAYQLVLWAREPRRADLAQSRAHLFRAGRVGFLVAVVAVLILNYATQVSRRADGFTDNDDYVAYLPFIRRLYDTGSLIEPFNMRRLAAYGGHTFLQAESIALGSWRHAVMLERGIGPILVAGLLWGVFRPRTAFQLLVASLLVLAFALFPLPRANSYANTLGVVAFLTLARTFLLPDPWPARAWVVGIVLAGACSLRANYVAPAVLAVMFAYAGRAVVNRAGWRRELAQLVLAGALALLLLAPWMLLLYRSSNTPFYPVFRGNEWPDVNFLSEPLGTLELVRWVARMMAFPLMAAICAPVVLVLRRAHVRDLLPVYLAAIAGAVMMAAAFTTADAPNLARYSAPPVFACCAAAVAVATSETGRPRRRLIVLVGLAVASVAGTIVMYPTLHRVVQRRIGAAAPAHSTTTNATTIPTTHAPPDPLFDPSTRDLYARAQQRIPAGERVLAAVDYPFFFDYARNDVQTLDGAGVCSLPPGMPVFDGSQAVKRYLLGHGIRYVIATDFDRAHVRVVRRKYWQRPDNEFDRPQLPHRPYHLNWMDRADELAASEELVYVEGNIRLIRLR